MLDLEQKEEHGVVVLQLGGQLDALTANELRPLIDELVANKAPKVVFDLAELKMIDSSGVGAIVSLFKRLRMVGGDVKIARLASQPKEIFRLLRLDHVFDIFASVEAASKTFK